MKIFNKKELKDNSMKPFITGSYAYGNPTKDSDIDVVLRVDPDVYGLFLITRDDDKTNKCIRFGKLNLVCCQTDKEYWVWFNGTEELIARSKITGEPINKIEATKVFDRLREQAGIEDEYKGLLEKTAPKFTTKEV